ncbi:MAG: hypothetical protein V1861_00985 [Candidatus Micrarchaeota archaeon]
MSLANLMPVLVVICALFLFFSGCIAIPVQQDNLASRLEALNGEIASADTYDSVANLTGEVKSLEASIRTSGTDQGYLSLAQAQILVLQLINASILYGEENDAIVSDGIDCSRDYTALIATLKGMNSTKQLALSELGPYLANNPNSTAMILLSLVNSTDAEGASIYADALGTKSSYVCPVIVTPSGTYAVPLDEGEATALVVDEVVRSDQYYVYSPGFALDVGTNISVRDYSGGFTNRILGSETWFFMLDKTPAASFSHPVRFVYVDAASGDYYVTEEEFNPIINGLNFWWSKTSRLNASWVVYPENPALYDINDSALTERRSFSFPLGGIAAVPAGTDCSSMDCCKEAGKDFAFVVNGADENEPTTDAKMMYYYLRGTGISADDISYLTPNPNTHESDAVTTPKNLGAAISALAGQMGCCDRLFIYITGHGNRVAFHKFKNKKTGETKEFADGELPETGMRDWKYVGTDVSHIIDVNSYIEEPAPDFAVLGNYGTVAHGNKEGDMVWASEIGDALNSIKSCYVTLIYDSCYSGWARGGLKGKGRTVITSSGAGPSYGSGSGNSNWVKGWLDAHSSSKTAADSNNDGKVDDKEASDFASKKAGSMSAGAERQQFGTWTSAAPCACCYVACNESTNQLCTVVEGEGKNDPRCKKVGDSCGTTITTGNVTSTPPNVTIGNNTIYSNDTNGTNPPPSSPVCGDGIITSPEVCDPGKSATAACPVGKKCCPETCRCIQSN